MTKMENRSRDALMRPSFAHHDDARKDSPSPHDPEKWRPVFGPDHAQKRGKRSAERRMPSMSADRRQVHANLRNSSATRLRALSALTLAALATGYYPDG